MNSFLFESVIAIRRRRGGGAVGDSRRRAFAAMAGCAHVDDEGALEASLEAVRLLRGGVDDVVQGQEIAERVGRFAQGVSDLSRKQADQPGVVPRRFSIDRLFKLS